MRISQTHFDTKLQYDITLNREMRYHPVLMDEQVFTLIKEKIKNTTINIVSRELDKAEILAEKFNKRFSFGVAPPAEKVVLLNVSFQCSFHYPFKCWLYHCVVDVIAIPISCVCTLLDNEI